MEYTVEQRTYWVTGSIPNTQLGLKIPRLYQPGFFLWGLLKDRVYANQPRMLQDLKDNISTEIKNITEETLHRVTANMQTRVEACLLENGGHFQHLF
jgi:hypothetical protein